MEKRPKKIIPWWQHHLCLDVTVQKSKSPCHHAKVVADAIVVVLIFFRTAMEKPNPLYPLLVPGRKRR